MNSGPSDLNTASCPIPIREHSHILMAHGGGGRLMHELIGKMFVAQFNNPALSAQHDSSIFEVGGQRLAFTTDSYVVRPPFFPGGNIGSLAVHGTVNDLAMSGARPLCLSAAFIIEEGLSMATLSEIVRSMRDAAAEAGVQVITGDTKVVDKGKGDGVFINTAGIGIIEHDLRITPRSVKSGDAILVSGDVGRHGMAIMAMREGLEFESVIESDSAPVSESVLGLIASNIKIHCLRDLTRGGLTSALNEIAESSGLTCSIDETAVPVRGDVRAACEILGLDPFQVACEGRYIAFVPENDADRALATMRRGVPDSGPARIGTVLDERDGRVLLKGSLGALRLLDMPTGEQLPRIC